MSGAQVLSSEEKQLHNILLELFVTIAGNIIQADQLLKKSNPILQQKNFAEQYPTEYLLLMKLYTTVPALQAEFMQKLKQVFKNLDIGILKLFVQTQDTFSLEKTKEALNANKSFNTKQGIEDIAKLCAALFEDQVFGQNLIDLFRISNELRQLLIAQKSELEETLIYRTLSSSTNDELVFAMQTPAKIPLFTNQLVKIDPALLEKYAIKTQKLVDNAATLVNTMNNSINYIDYNKYNPNMALVLSLLEKSNSKTPGPVPPTQAALRQLLLLLTMLPKIIDKNGLRVELSMQDKAYLQLLVDMLQNFEEHVRKNLDVSKDSPEADKAFTKQLDLKLRGLLETLQAEPTEVEEIITQMQVAYNLAKNILKQEKVTAASAPPELSKINNDVEYAINRYLHSFNPPHSQIDFFEAEYLLDYIMKHNVKLTEHSVVVLNNIASRNKTIVGRAARRVSKFITVRARRASKTDDQNRPLSPQPQDEKEAYRENLANWQARAQNRYADLLVALKIAQPPIPARPGSQGSLSFRKSAERPQSSGSKTASPAVAWVPSAKPAPGKIDPPAVPPKSALVREAAAKRKLEPQTEKTAPKAAENTTEPKRSSVSARKEEIEKRLSAQRASLKLEQQRNSRRNSNPPQPSTKPPKL